MFLCLGCAQNDQTKMNDENSLETKRMKMVKTQIEARGVKDAEVLRAMRKIPRHEFVASGFINDAYNDTPLPIAAGQTISQPYIVAYMTEKLDLKKTDRVLEIGTGSGYQAAVLAEIVDTVYTIEIIEELANGAGKILRKLGYSNVKVRHGDGYQGWPESAPFDAVIITAAPPKLPKPLLDQLAEGGRLISPVGDYYQELVLIENTGQSGFRKQTLIPVRFVPMTGEIQSKQE